MAKTKQIKTEIMLGKETMAEFSFKLKADTPIAEKGKGKSVVFIDGNDFVINMPFSELKEELNQLNK